MALSLLQPIAVLLPLSIRRCACRRCALACIGANVTNHDAMMREGVVPVLVSLSTHEDEAVRQYSAYALVRLGHNGEVRETITAEGGLEVRARNAFPPRNMFTCVVARRLSSTWRGRSFRVEMTQTKRIWQARGARLAMRCCGRRHRGGR